MAKNDGLLGGLASDVQESIADWGTALKKIPAPPKTKPPKKGGKPKPAKKATQTEKLATVDWAERHTLPSEVPSPPSSTPRPVPLKTPVWGLDVPPKTKPKANLDTRYKWAVGSIVDPVDKQKLIASMSDEKKDEKRRQALEFDRAAKANWQPPLTPTGKLDTKKVQALAAAGNPDAADFIAARSGRSFGGLVGDVATGVGEVAQGIAGEPIDWLRTQGAGLGAAARVGTGHAGGAPAPPAPTTFGLGAVPGYAIGVGRSAAALGASAGEGVAGVIKGLAPGRLSSGTGGPQFTGYTPEEQQRLGIIPLLGDTPFEVAKGWGKMVAGLPVATPSTFAHFGQSVDRLIGMVRGGGMAAAAAAAVLIDPNMSIEDKRKVGAYFFEKSKKALVDTYGPDVTWRQAAVANPWEEGFLHLIDGVTALVPAAKGASIFRYWKVAGTTFNDAVKLSRDPSLIEHPELLERAPKRPQRAPGPRTVTVRQREGTGDPFDVRVSQSKSPTGRVGQAGYDIFSRGVEKVGGGRIPIVKAITPTARGLRITGRQYRRAVRRLNAEAAVLWHEISSYVGTGDAAEGRRAQLFYNVQKPADVPDEAWLRAVGDDAQELLDKGMAANGPREPTELEARLQRQLTQFRNAADVAATDRWLTRVEDVHHEQARLAHSRMAIEADLRTHQAHLAELKARVETDPAAAQALGQEIQFTQDLISRDTKVRKALKEQQDDLSPHPSTPVESATRTDLQQKVNALPKVSEQEAEGLFRLLDTRARRWGRENDRDPGEWYSAPDGFGLAETRMIEDWADIPEGSFAQIRNVRNARLEAETNPHRVPTPRGGVKPLDEAATAAHIEKSIEEAGRMRSLDRNPETLLNTFREAHRLATVGVRFRKWYRTSAQGILDHVHGDVEEADKLAQLFGIYSANRDVPANSVMALRAYDQARAGLPITEGSANQISHAMKVMDGIPWEGRKTNSFYANMLKHIDSKKYLKDFKKREVTVDVWMMRMFGFKGKSPTDAQYTWIENQIRELARQLGWSPEEVQAAAWVAIKSESEATSLETAAFDFAHGIATHRGQIAFEAMSDALRQAIPPELRSQHLHDVLDVIAPGGRSRIHEIVGVPGSGSHLGPGVETVGEEILHNPGAAFYVPLLRSKGPKGDYVISEAERQMANEASAVLGTVLNQRAVAYGRTFQAKTIGDANAVELILPAGLSDELAARIATAVGGDTAVIHSHDGAWLVNFTGTENKAWLKQTEEALKSVDPALEERATAVAYDGGLVNRSDYADLIERLEQRRPGARKAVHGLASDVERVTQRYLGGGRGKGGVPAEVPRPAGPPDVAPGESGVREGRDTAPVPRQLAPDEPLQGLPPRRPVGGAEIPTGPSAEVRGLAEEHARRNGISYQPVTTYAQVDVPRAEGIAKAYEEMLDINDPKATPEYVAEVLASYQAMAEETLAQYKTLEQAGYRFEFYPRDANGVAHDPYGGNPWGAMEDLRDNKHLYVYPTESGFGMEGDLARVAGGEHPNPLLVDSGIKWNGQPVVVNDLFRAVHDVFGHFKEGVGFRAHGEENAWRSHSAMYSPLARKAMTTETRGQNSWVNFGPHAERNRAAGQLETVYAEQKTGILPQRMIDEGARDAGSLKAHDPQPPGTHAQVREGDLRGAVQFLNTTDGQRILYLTQSADISTLLHEMFGHGVREISKAYPSEWAQVEAWIGRPLAEWAVEDHERFARMTERYFMSGRAPVPELVDTFQHMKHWMRAVYGGINRETNVPIAVRNALDHYFGSYDDNNVFRVAAMSVRHPDARRVETGRPRQLAVDTALRQQLAELGFTEEQISKGAATAVRLIKLYHTDPEKFASYVARSIGAMKQGQGAIVDAVQGAKSAQHAFGVTVRRAFDEQVKQPGFTTRAHPRTGQEMRGAEASILAEFTDKHLAELRRRNDARAYARTKAGIAKKFQAWEKKADEAGGVDNLTPEEQDAYYRTWQKLIETHYSEEIAKMDRENGLRARYESIEKALAEETGPAYEGAITAMRGLIELREKVLRGVFGDTYDQIFLARVDLLADYMADKGFIPPDFERGTATYVPHRPLGDRTRIMDRPGIPLTGNTVGQTKSLVELGKRNELQRWQNGDLRADPMVVFESWQNAQAFHFVYELKKKLWDVGRPLRFDEPIPDGAFLINFNGVPVPNLQRVAQPPGITADAQSALKALEGRDAGAIEQKLTDYVNDVLKPSEQTRDWLNSLDPPDRAAALAKHRIVDRKVVEAMFRPLRGSTDSTVGTAWDMANTIARWSLIYSNPAYIPINFIGNSLFVLAQQGPAAISNYVRAAKVALGNRALAVRVAAEGGEVPAIAGIARGRARTPGLRKFYKGEESALRGLTIIPDRYPRIAAWIYEARRLGYKSAEDMHRLLDGGTEALDHHRELIAERTNEIMVNFDRLSDWERQSFTRVLFIWPWIRGATAWPFYYAKEYPLVTGVAANVGRQVEEYRKEQTGEVPLGYRDLFPLWQQGGYAQVINTAPISPTSTAAQSIEAIKSNVLSLIGDQNVESGTALLDFMQPVFQAGLQEATGVDQFGAPISHWDALYKNAANFIPRGATLLQMIDPSKASGAYRNRTRRAILQRGGIWPPGIGRLAPYDIDIYKLQGWAARGVSKSSEEKIQGEISKLRKQAQYSNAPQVQPYVVRGIRIAQWLEDQKEDIKDRMKKAGWHGTSSQQTEPDLSDLQEAWLAWRMYKHFFPHLELPTPEGVPDYALEDWTRQMLYGKDTPLSQLSQYRAGVNEFLKAKKVTQSG